MKDNMVVKIFIGLFFILLLGVVIMTIKDSKNTSTESEINGKDISKEEYIYKEDLFTLGYNLSIINNIENKISNIDVKNYLLSKKYDNLNNYLSSPYFKTKNIERYEDYYLKNPNYSYDQIVLYVEIGLDIPFYTNINIIEDYTSVTTLVNKYNQLPKDAKFDNLVVLEKPYSNTGERKIRNEMYEPLKQMIDDAKKDGLDLYAVSAFRSWDTQEYLFNNSKKKNGLDYALTYSAKPGHSEHELGLAVDLNTTQDKFKNTKEYAWLKLNAYKYGFIERYPEGKEFITGYGYEPWHYRYLGIDIATKIKEENITYEEYLIKYKNSSY